ncbi:MAG: LysM peptidoglycan-binding domain-containing protein [Anaerolineales bacterium]|nr:LysM peptidoglycan-binding domain-containing protein [Anaerolineales bacterium]
MDQISKTVNSFLASIVGVGLICFASFIFLLASAQLNNSLLGDLLARVAGETARTARTESFSYWGRVGAEVADGLGYGLPLTGGGGTGVIITPVVIVPTAPPAGTPAPAAPTATPRPSSFVRSSPYSEGGLLLWRGLDASQQRLPFGVSLKNVAQQASYALQQNQGDLLAIWLQNRIRQCEPLYNQMVQANYQDTSQTQTIISAADTLIAQCNPRLLEAYARKRWATLATWLAQVPPDEARAAEVLGGLKILIGNKLDGPARQTRPQDTVEVSVQSVPEFALSGITFRLTAGALDALLGADKWQLNSGPYPVPGLLFPENPAEPALPSEADLTPATTAPGTTTGQPEAGASASSAQPGIYIVQKGDTLYNIARKFNITPQALIDANKDKVGFNPDYITIGMELRIP